MARYHKLSTNYSDTQFYIHEVLNTYPQSKVIGNKLRIEVIMVSMQGSNSDKKYLAYHSSYGIQKYLLT